MFSSSIATDHLLSYLPLPQSYTVESYQAALVPICFLLVTLTFTEFVIFK
jgi:hypothetical protein